MQMAAVSRQNASAARSPLALRQSLGFFALPWLLFVISIYVVLPALDRAGVPLFANFLISLGVPLGLLLVAALIAYRREGLPWKADAFRQRFRLQGMKGSTWLWTLGLSVIMLLGPGLLSWSSSWIQQIAPMPAPLPRIFDVTPTTFMGVPLTGAWWVLAGYLLYVVLNVLGEELWWRGYVLPRQELALGAWTWLVHGILWNLFHSFLYWELLGLLPGCLALSYVAYRSKNTWPGMIAHFVSALPALVLIVAGVLS